MTEAIFTLPDGRKLSYAVYGPATGRTVLYFHGTPSSRKELLLLPAYGIPLESLLQQYNLQLLAPDRGALTSFDPQQSFLSFAQDVVQLLQHRGVQPCPVLCWSGGGPYALTIAYHFPQRITGVYILCGITKPFNTALLRQMSRNKWYFRCARYAPLLLRFLLALLRKKTDWPLPPRRLTGLTPVDYRLLQKGFRLITDCTVKEFIRKGTKAAAHEAALYFTPSNFSVADVQQPLHYWWGTADSVVVKLHALEVEQCAPQPVLHYRSGEGHLSTYLHCFGEALGAIVQSESP